MKATEVRAMSVEDLEKKLADLKKDLFNLRLQNATNQLDNPNKIGDVKKDIARVKTIIREKQTASNADLLKEEIDYVKQNFFPQDQSRHGRFR